MPLIHVLVGLPRPLAPSTVQCRWSTFLLVFLAHLPLPLYNVVDPRSCWSSSPTCPFHCAMPLIRVLVGLPRPLAPSTLQCRWSTFLFVFLAHLPLPLCNVVDPRSCLSSSPTCPFHCAMSLIHVLVGLPRPLAPSTVQCRWSTFLLVFLAHLPLPLCNAVDPRSCWSSSPTCPFHCAMSLIHVLVGLPRPPAPSTVQCRWSTFLLVFLAHLPLPLCNVVDPRSCWSSSLTCPFLSAMSLIHVLVGLPRQLAPSTVQCRWSTFLLVFLAHLPLPLCNVVDPRSCWSSSPTCPFHCAMPLIHVLVGLPRPLAPSTVQCRWSTFLLFFLAHLPLPLCNAVDPRSCWSSSPTCRFHCATPLLHVLVGLPRPLAPSTVQCRWSTFLLVFLAHLPLPLCNAVDPRSCWSSSPTCPFHWLNLAYNHVQTNPTCNFQKRLRCIQVITISRLYHGIPNAIIRFSVLYAQVWWPLYG